MFRKLAVSSITIFTLAVAAPAAPASTSTGGSTYDPSPPSSSASKPVVPGNRAKLRNGIAYAPANAPEAVKRMIWAANKIQNKPYVYGGGHGSINDRGYDCSGTVSYALHHGGILDGSPRDSVGFQSWGRPGKGEWVTVYANNGHAFMVIAGLRLDTSRYNDARATDRGPRWRTTLRPTGSFRARHWPGL